MLPRVRLICLLVFALAWGLRLAYVQESRRAGLAFLEDAAGAARSASLERPDAYDALRARARAAFGDAERATLFLQILQAGAGAMTALTVALLGMGLLGPAAGAAAGLLHATAGPALFHEQRPLGAGFHALAVVAAVAALHHARGLGGARRWLVAGALLLAAAWAVPAFAAAGAVVLLWAALSPRGDRNLDGWAFPMLVCGAAALLAWRSWGGAADLRLASPAAIRDVLAAAEPPGRVNWEFWRERLGPAAALAPSWIVAGPLGLAGAALLLPHWRRALLLLGAPLAGAAWLGGRMEDGADRLWVFALLCVPAGYALVRVLGAMWETRGIPFAAGVAVWALSTAALSSDEPYRPGGGDFLLAGRLAERAGNGAAALELYEEGARLDPGAPALAERACRAALLELRLAPALARCARAEALVPGRATALQGVGLAQRASGEYDAAMDAFLRARDADPYDPFIYLNLAYLHVREGRAEAALRSLDEAERLGAGSPDLYYALGLLYRLSGKPKRAIAEFERGLEADPKGVESRIALARMLEETGEYAKAREAYEAILASGEDRADVHLRLGLLYDRRLGDPQEALQHLKRSLDLDPRQRDKEALEFLIRDVENRLIFGAEPPPDEDLAAEGDSQPSE